MIPAKRVIPIDLSQRIAKCKPHPFFAQALAALDAGDLQLLRSLIKAEPDLIHARANLEPPYHYFTGATLLHHVAGNPGRNSLPSNIVKLAGLLLDSGADGNASTLGPNGGTTMGLLITSKLASDAGVSAPLIDLLLKHGAKLNLTKAGILDAPLANHAPCAAEKMIKLGAKVDLCAAAALGRMKLIQGFFDAKGYLRPRPRRNGCVLSQRDAIGLALLFAYVNQQPAAVDFLLQKDGNWEMLGVNNGTVLHRAAVSGDLEMVQRLMAKGASLSNRNNPFNATPYSWADHSQQTAVCKWMRENCAIDLHDAVCFDLRRQVRDRLREDPTSIHKRVNQWRVMPNSTPLQCAIFTKRKAMTRLLLAMGAEETS